LFEDGALIINADSQNLDGEDIFELGGSQHLKTEDEFFEKF